MTKKEKFLTKIRDSGDAGYSKAKALQDIPTTQSGVFSMAHTLRKEGHIIKQDNGVYWYKGQKSNSTARSYHDNNSLGKALPVVVDSPAGSAPSVGMGKESDIIRMLSSKQVLKDISSLSKSDRSDFLEMVKKSVFYRISAEGVLKASKFVDELEKELTVLG